MKRKCIARATTCCASFNNTSFSRKTPNGNHPHAVEARERSRTEVERQVVGLLSAREFLRSRDDLERFRSNDALFSTHRSARTSTRVYGRRPK